MLDVFVQPRASRNEVAGRHGEALKIRLTAPPVEGAANEALVRFVAESLSLPRSAVSVVSGHASRRKRLAIEGADPVKVAALMG
ncbi:MAG: hypothetical protein RL026_2316 [Pseudomonadota bacterium]